MKTRELSINERLAIAPILGGIIAKDAGGTTPIDHVEEAIAYWLLLKQAKVEDDDS